MSRPLDDRRRLVVWLLVCLVACQSLLVSMTTAIGPSHRHQVSARVLVLEDVRRVASPSPARPVHVLTALGHFHGSESQRHYHLRTDASVVPTEGGAAMGDDDGVLGAAAPFVALLAAARLWTASASSAVPASGSAWAAITADLERLERPPRRA